MSQYRVISGEFRDQFADEVNMMLEAGWKCQGGVYVSIRDVEVDKGYTETLVYYAQAMIRDAA